MRFTAIRDLPDSEYIEEMADTEEFCTYLERSEHLIGFDTETSGLEQDGLGVRTFVVCLATHERRAAIILTPENTDRVFACLERTQERHCGFNIIYDWNAIYGHSKYVLGRRNPTHLTKCWADGMKLWCHFDEEGEETYGNRGLKYRARHYIGLPMNDFDKIIESGDIMKGFEVDFDRTLDYCTRDAWAHLGICLLGAEIARQMPWGATCSKCGYLAFQQNDEEKWFCPDHGYVEPGRETSIWDWNFHLDNEFLSILQKMQVRGMPIDWEYLENTIEPLERSLSNQLRKFQAEVDEALVKEGGTPWGVNPNSTKQLQKLYHRRSEHGRIVGFGYPVQGRTEGGDASVSDSHLQKLVVHYDAPGVLHLLRYKEQSKILSTYVRGMLERKFGPTGRIHGSLRPVTTTGRLRSRDPNMQNFPTGDLVVELDPPAGYVPTIEDMVEQWGLTVEEAEEELKKPEWQPVVIHINIRKAVCAPDGHMLVCADYAQLELRLAAIESGCPKMIAAINEGRDLHCYAASRAFEGALGGMGYDELNEVKSWSDRIVEPRMETATRLLSLPEHEAIQLLETRAASAKLLPAERTKAVRQGLQLVGALRDREWDAETEEFLLLAEVLGLRDKELKGLRASAKSAIFGIIYGIGPTRLAYQITEITGQVCSLDEAKSLIESITEDVFDGVGQMIRRLQGTVKEYGYIRTLMGRYRHPAGVFSGHSGRRAQSLRQSQNSPIQGLAADVVQKAMIAVDRDTALKRMGARMINQVHDELLVEVREEDAQETLDRVRYLMENAHGIDAPVHLATSGNIGKTWDDAK